MTSGGSRLPIWQMLGLALFVVMLAPERTGANYLTTDFYDQSCPQALSIVQRKVDEFIEADRGLAGALLRLHFHDCFVRGCDGSVLLNSTEDSLAEKEALLNKGSLRGFEEIDAIKMELECACPGVVSCADILALVARDATAKVGGYGWPVFLGRIDGAGSVGEEVNGSLPERRDNFTTLVANFARHGLDAKDMIILSGSHTIGVAHCGAFFERLYNFEGTNETDPSMDASLAKFLKKRCPIDKPLGLMALGGTNGTFDTDYYKNLLTKRGLLESDVTLTSDSYGMEIVTKAVEEPSWFLTEFGIAMIKMGFIEGTHPYGWRKHCAVIEPRE
ncbi:hypothetical protein Mapa_007389 [Marchantia paleacea]|nr:hypothetical protein Mapa_007389 [Marchantia paleacea]